MGDRVAVGAVVPDLAFDGVGESGAPATIHLRDYARTGTLVVRVQGGEWCGTCNWHAAHTSELVAKGERVLDLVLGDRDNAPASARDAASWRRTLDVQQGVAVGVDPSFAFRPLLEGALPLVVVIDTATMTIVRAESNPAPDGPLVDGLFDRQEWDMIRAIRPPAPLEARDAKAALGEALFEDVELSPAHVGCVTCHDPTRAFADDRPVAIGAARGDRHTPRIALAAGARSQFWDGRAATLEEQARGPIENAAEMHSSPAFVAARVASAHREAFQQIFPGALGDDDAVMADVMKAIASYERSLSVAPNALDRYAAGDFGALDFQQKQGLVAFTRQGCMQCHWGPRLTDDAFHVTRTPTGRADGTPDVGRAGHLGAFKTPSLRGVGHAKFFAHGGAIDSLDAMVASYGDGANGDARSVGDREPWIRRFGETTRWAIVKLLETLD